MLHIVGDCLTFCLICTAMRIKEEPVVCDRWSAVVVLRLS
jgi:hypothetical protein